MELVSGSISIQIIISDHWAEFYRDNQHLITRPAILDNIDKILACGKKTTDQWVIKNTNLLPNTKWQHITFTMPDL